MGFSYVCDSPLGAWTRHTKTNGWRYAASGREEIRLGSRKKPKARKRLEKRARRPQGRQSHFSAARCVGQFFELNEHCLFRYILLVRLIFLSCLAIWTNK